MDAHRQQPPVAKKTSTFKPIKRLVAEEDQFYRQKFLDESPRLFRKDTDKIETWVVPISDTDQVHITQSIKETFQEDNSENQLYLHILRQEYSWGRLLISQASLERLIAHHNIFWRFYELINGFGFKTHEDDKVWDGFHSNRTTDLTGDGKDARYELCYTIRYIDKNGRDPKQPWSLRQVGLYQQTRNPEEPSVWILVQPPERLCQQLNLVLTGALKHELKEQDRDMMLHLITLSVTLSNWGQYIEELRDELSQLENKACFSRVGIDKSNDYPVAFGDKQKLQRFRQKLVRLQNVFDATRAVIKSLKTQFREFRGRTFTEQNENGIAELDGFLALCKRHKRGIEALMQVASGTDELLSKILEFRNDRILLQTNQAMQNSLDALNRISTQSADVAEQGRLDSRTLKVLTVIATMYLPASLLATLFSSNLIQTVQNGAPAEKDTHFELVTQFWIYILLTAVLTTATLLPTLVLQKKLRIK